MKVIKCNIQMSICHTNRRWYGYIVWLVFRAINANPLNCDCEMRAFRQSINARQGDLLVITAQCEGTNIRMTDLSDSQFGSCSGITSSI